MSNQKSKMKVVQVVDNQEKQTENKENNMKHEQEINEAQTEIMDKVDENKLISPIKHNQQMEEENVLSERKINLVQIEKQLNDQSNQISSKLKENMSIAKQKLDSKLNSQIKENPSLNNSKIKAQTYKKCAICNEGYGEKKTVALVCLHKFHEECVVKKGKQTQCPLCNAAGKHIQTPAESQLKSKQLITE